MCSSDLTTLVPALRQLDESSFDDGRFNIRELARYHIRDGYRAKSVRCRECVFNDRCDGAHINFLRDQGLKSLTPMTATPWTNQVLDQWKQLEPQPEKRLANGRMFEPAADSLPGYAQPKGIVEDPLAVIARNVAKRRAKRRAEIRAKIAAERKA